MNIAERFAQGIKPFFLPTSSGSEKKILIFLIRTEERRKESTHTHTHTHRESNLCSTLSLTVLLTL